jgi:hypothetical protein
MAEFEAKNGLLTQGNNEDEDCGVLDQDLSMVMRVRLGQKGTPTAIIYDSWQSMKIVRECADATMKLWSY